MKNFGMIEIDIQEAFKQTKQDCVYFALEKVRIRLVDETGYVKLAPLVIGYTNYKSRTAEFIFSQYSDEFFELIENENYMITYDGETEERLTRSSLESKMLELDILWRIERKYEME